MTTRKAARSLRRHGERARERLRYRRATPREGTRPGQTFRAASKHPTEELNETGQNSLTATGIRPPSARKTVRQVSYSG